jgi:N-methylhydantoinase A
VCALADALEMQQALVPVHGGVLSALGMIVAPRSRQLSHTVTGPLHDFTDQQINALLSPLIEQGKQALVKEGVNEMQIQISPSLDLRYLGQSYYLNCPWESLIGAIQTFHQLHETRYGHQLDLPVELVNVRVALYSEADKVEPSMQLMPHTGSIQQAQLHGIDTPVSIIHRDSLETGQSINGPALITETVSTTFIDAGWQARLLESGNLVLSKMKTT